jgi:hypothetical protein
MEIFAAYDWKPFQSCLLCYEFVQFLTPSKNLTDPSTFSIVEWRRDIPYGPRNLQKFAHFHWLNPKYFGLNQ